MKLLPDLFCEYYCLVSQNGYRFAHVLVDADYTHLLPLETVYRAGWEIELLCEEQESIVHMVNCHPKTIGNLFPASLPFEPLLLLTFPFWQCACETAFVHHDLETRCPFCGAKEDQKRGMRYFELVAENIDLTLDLHEVKQGLHVLH